MNKNIDYDKMLQEAEYVFTHGFACSETVIYIINKTFDLGMPDSLIASSSGFPWGLGGGGCICGALAGGCMCIGYLTGKHTIEEERNPLCHKLCQKLHDEFKKDCKSTCCRVLMKGLERDAPERKLNCIEYVKVATRVTANIIKEIV
jgi:C_GCAxxG_C_C family probable redox protein